MERSSHDVRSVVQREVCIPERLLRRCFLHVGHHDPIVLYQVLLGDIRHWQHVHAEPNLHV